MPTESIFGLGSIGRTSCVVSIFRLGKKNVSGINLLERLVKAIHHEMGHTLGLDHCPHCGCLMEECVWDHPDRGSGERKAVRRLPGQGSPIRKIGTLTAENAEDPHGYRQ